MPQELLNIATCYFLVPIFGLCYFFCLSTYDCKKANSLRWPCPCLNEPIMCYWPQGHQEFPPESAIKNQTKLLIFSLLFNHIFLLMSWKYICVANKKYDLDQWETFSHSCMVVISFNFLLQNSEFYWPFGLVFDSGNSIVSNGVLVKLLFIVTSYGWVYWMQSLAGCSKFNHIIVWSSFVLAVTAHDKKVNLDCSFSHH